MEKRFILAIDQSTAGTKALLIDHDGNIQSKSYASHSQIHPQLGWVEHDPMEILANVRMLIEQLLAQAAVSAAEIQCLAITNQRETVLAWDRETGKPVYNAIVWQCSRAGDQCQRIRDLGMEEQVKAKTGLPLSEFFSAAKLAWIMDNVEHARALKAEGRLLCGTVDSWLVWNLSREKNHITDYSNASRTQLMDLQTLRWDDMLLEAFGLSAAMMPRILFSDQVVGHMCLDGCQIPIAGVIGDSHGALFAQCGLGTGIKVTYGTGSSVMAGTGPDKLSSTGLATTVSYACGGKVNFAIEGNINSTGATVKWLTDQLQLLPSAGDAEAMATELDGNGGVYFVPAFSGLGAPHWAPDAKALLTGMTFDTDKRHIVRAALESIAYQITDVVKAIEADTGLAFDSLMVDGKPTENRFLMEFQASLCGKAIVRNRVEEASAYGSALLAGLGTGFWQAADLDRLIRHGAIFSPCLSRKQVDALYDGWCKAIALAKMA